MYLRGDHAEPSIPHLQQFIRENPLGILTTAIQSPNHPLLYSSHIPWVLDAPDDPDSTENGTLRGHIARQNPQSKVIIESLKAANTSQIETEVLVLFNGPYHHYVTPKFYTETKPATGKVVPTWNYSAVQAYGKATIYHDSASPETSAYLSKQLKDLTRHCEENVMGYTGGPTNPTAWEVDDAPQRYLEFKQKNIIGIEIRIDRLEGKYKMGQENTRGDRQGVIDGFNGLGTDVGFGNARTVKERGDIKDAKRA